MYAPVYIYILLELSVCWFQSNKNKTGWSHRQREIVLFGTLVIVYDQPQLKFCHHTLYFKKTNNPKNQQHNKIDIFECTKKRWLQDKKHLKIKMNLPEAWFIRWAQKQQNCSVVELFHNYLVELNMQCCGQIHLRDIKLLQICKSWVWAEIRNRTFGWIRFKNCFF